MINIIYKLVSPKLFEEVYDEATDLDNKVVVRPTHLSICQADQRYFQGNRDPETLNEKLPMALIHEGIGEVINDNTGTFNEGDLVVIIPNTPTEEDDIIAENYLRSSNFRASGFDGFMQDYIISDSDRLVKISKDINREVASFTELISVSVHSIDRFSNFSHKRKKIIGVWGDGNLGYITSLLLKIFFPESKIIVFGKNNEKLNLFTFADETFRINEVPDEIKIDHAFECVGGRGSQPAINQIIDLINPEGTISLLGVSEYDVPMNTRMILEKGLLLFGTSRSGRSDFIKTIEIFKEHPKILKYLENIINDIIEIRTLNDINLAFEKDFNSSFGKTVLIWNK
ncbi:putative ribitol-5-phosphate dehydrogenase [Methanobrevibacter arboriphilus JCM 13429 = DSM 1125]|uniref:Putative ribitol-5-phosphate dehydrogenase n=1 Tax=Methanobrevibacter arboriphilus JCM 13429 = DSM 1125 TaxID=1300164 RepID=A0A1V6N400_METAZ|nr:alcohol dehydrogenase catalytic domain-containing protein [Methanobrevibacter arboriphilus]OQD59391.1 putative ribitol-5-phosphate dehydrogenase [Methanobrevibacter arboriphilus JCM 13429 = DSM 1125]